MENKSTLTLPSTHRTANLSNPSDSDTLNTIRKPDRRQFSFPQSDFPEADEDMQWPLLVPPDLSREMLLSFLASFNRLGQFLHTTCKAIDVVVCEAKRGRGMKLLSIVCVSLAALWLQSAAQTYDESKVRKYAEATQHLRTGLRRDQDNLWNDIVFVSAEAQSRINLINAQKDAALALISNTMSRMFSSLQNMTGILFTPMVLATAADPYSNGNQPLYTNVQLQHGMDFESGEAVISKAGVYMLEFKAQTSDYDSYNSDISIYSHDGYYKYAIDTFHDWEVSPHFYMLHLEAGDTVKFHSFYYSNGWLSGVTGGVATQFNLRYLGDSP
ncbi:uncharacterized protein LOC143296617 [Babylonia areolata]|uniref:uncharacterized protein LOC143296617 n=1 Tax=Babylonia areolata TaxID=304850 RepID=UPI003FD3B5FB